MNHKSLLVSYSPSLYDANFFLLQVMQESLMMIPDSHRRLEKAYAELKALVDAEEAEMAEAKEFQEAKAVLAEADEQLKAS